MDTFIRELEKIVTFKGSTAEGDIVLIAARDPQFLGYALVTKIEKDPGRKQDWWCVHMQLLTIPPRKIIWTLREQQFTGQEVFTMDGAERFVKAVRFEKDEDEKNQQPGQNNPAGQGAKSNPFRIVK